MITSPPAATFMSYRCLMCPTFEQFLFKSQERTAVFAIWAEQPTYFCKQWDTKVNCLRRHVRSSSVSALSQPAPSTSRPLPASRCLLYIRFPAPPPVPSLDLVTLSWCIGFRSNWITEECSLVQWPAQWASAWEHFPFIDSQGTFIWKGRRGVPCRPLSHESPPVCVAFDGSAAQPQQQV